MAIFNAPKITTAQRNSLTLSSSEIVFDTNEKIFYGGDGSTVGGFPIGSGATTSQSVVCRNNTGSTIPQFRVVYINGALGNEPTIQLAIANTDPTSSKTFGVTKLPIANNTSGVIVHSGEIDDLNTSAFADGDLLWLSPTTAGALTKVRPSSPNHAVFIGYIIRSHPTLGKIIVTIQNGLEIGELHDVEISLVADNQVLKYDAPNLLWKNETLDAENIPMVSEAISVEDKLISLQYEIDGEIANRIFADEDLQSAIDGEIANRIFADEELQSAIDSIPAIYDTIDSVNDKISLANAYADSVSADAVVSANAYTDEVATLTLLAANIYSDDASAGAVGSANAYTDSQIAALDDKVAKAGDTMTGQLVLQDSSLLVDYTVTEGIPTTIEIQTDSILSTVVDGDITTISNLTSKSHTITRTDASTLTSDKTIQLGADDGFNILSATVVNTPDNYIANITIEETGIYAQLADNAIGKTKLGTYAAGEFNVQTFFPDDTAISVTANETGLSLTTYDGLDTYPFIPTQPEQVTTKKYVDDESALKIGNTFESVSKNLRQYDYVLNYSLGVLTSIVYTVPSVGTITKTLNYTSGVLTSVVLSGSTPLSIQLTKTLTYTSGALTSIEYT